MLDKVSRLRSRLRDSTTTFAAVFTNPSLRRVQLAWTSTMLGQWAYYVALMVYAYEQGGAAAVGLVGLIRTLPAAASAPFSSLLSDRYRRERVMLVAQIGRMVVLAVSAAALWADAPAAFIYTAAGVMTVLGTAIKPAQAALLPSLASTPEELTAANVTFSSIESISLFVGPAIGGVLLAVTDEAAVFVTTAAASGLAALLVLGVRPGVMSERKRGPTEGFRAEVSAGFRTIFGERSLLLVSGLWTAHWLVGGAVNVLIVAAALDLLDLGEAGVGLLNSASGVGGLVGTFVAVALATRRRLASDLGIGLLLRGLPLVVMGVLVDPVVAVCLLIVNGVGNVLIDVSGSTLLQRMTRDEVRARVFGALNSSLIVGLGIGMIAAPVMIELVGIRGAFIAAGTAVLALTALSWRALSGVRPETKALLETVELLRSAPIFTPLAPAAVEHLAAAMTTVERPAGGVVFSQGEAGDRYYLVESGEVEVSVDGRLASTLGRGEGFGEIALLRDVPRTATVTARTDVVLHALERDDFIAVVSGHPASTEAADTVIADRLGAASPEVTRI